MPWLHRLKRLATCPFFSISARILPVASSCASVCHECIFEHGLAQIFEPIVLLLS